MPIQKVRVEHRFGIVSVTHKDDLEKRAKEKALNENDRDLTGLNKDDRDIKYDVTEDFVLRFNASDDTYREQFEKEARVYLNRVKRRIGIKCAGVGNHVNLSQGWQELMLLALCESRSLQEEALETLYISLYYSPISRNHVASLLEVATHVVGWLRASALAQPFLRTGEIKLLKVAQLVFLRIYYHQLANDLRNHKLKKLELGDALEVFIDQLAVYRPFPSVSFSMHFLGAVGRYLSNEWKTYEWEARVKVKNIPELLDRMSVNQDDETNPSDSNHVMGQSTDTLKTFKSFENDESEVKLGSKDLLVKSETSKDDHVIQNFSESDEGQPDRCPTADAIYRDCPVLWLALKLWRSVSHTRKGIQRALKELVNCKEVTENSNWVHEILSIFVFGEAAAIDDSVMKSYQEYACHRMPYAKQKKRHHHSDVKKPCASEKVGNTSRHSSLGLGATRDSFTQNLQEYMSLNSLNDSSGNAKEFDAAMKEAVNVSETAEETEGESMKRVLFHQMPSCAYRGALTAVSSTRNDDKASWSLHQIIVYTQCLGRICTRGKTSSIRKMALLGDGNGEFGLIQLLSFELDIDPTEGYQLDVSWEVRHVAVLELVKVVNWFREDLLNEGIMNVAWNALIQHKSQERDNRVLEAMKISRIEAEIENAQLKEMASTTMSIYARLSTNLAIILLPPLHPASNNEILTEVKVKKLPQQKKKESQASNKSRITIGENIMLSNVIKPEVKSMKKELWDTVQKVATEQFEKEVLEDETKRQAERESIVDEQMKELTKQVPKKPLRQRVK